MTDLVDPALIERIVGARRHPTLHYGRASHRHGVQILHSQDCVDSGIDLRECRFSVALDEGLDTELWADHLYRPVALAVLFDGTLAPVPSST